MIRREEGLTEIYERIKANRLDLGIKTFKRNPTKPARQEDLPCVFLHEGVDNITQRASRDTTGYPAKRVFEVTLELVTSDDTDIKALYRDFRTVIFTDRNNPPKVNAVIAEGTFINENRTEGPYGYGLPDVLGMGIILDLVYTDKL